ncbi:hypothetical protein FRC10_006093 [Ceratobasidium sp. 414]|nr:hypothetical protein FRC10_006093 [Ceratobasidium sp. 414]
MFHNELHVNSAGDPSLFDPLFLAALKTTKRAGLDLDDLPPLELPNDALEPAKTVDMPGATTKAGPSKGAPDEGDQVVTKYSAVERGTTGAVTYSRSLRNSCGGNPVRQEAWMEIAEEIMAKDDFSIATPGVVTRRRSIYDRYCVFICFRRPDFKFPDHYWLQSTVEKYWETFFVSLLTMSKGRSGEDGDKLRSTTVEQWGITFVWVVGRYTVDNDGNRVGTALLHKGGLWHKIRDRIIWFIHKFDLVRHAQFQAFIGRSELVLMLRHGYNTTTSYGRMPFQQTAVATNIIFQIGTRAGSLGWSNVQYRQIKHYMMLKDLLIEQEGRCKWSVTISVVNAKGMNMTVDAPVSRFKLDPVTKIHNLWFDAGMHILTYLLMRDALEDCETLNDIFNYKERVFRIKEDKRTEPLFLERTAKGQELGEGPASATGLTHSLSLLGAACGVRGVTSHAIRRETGNRVGLVLGASAAQMLLGHTEARDTFSTHYSHNTLNLPVTDAALGTLDHTATAANQIALKRHTRSQLAVQALLFQLKSDTAQTEKAGDADLPSLPQSRKKHLTAEQDAIVSANPQVQQCEVKLAELWEEFDNLMPPQERNTHEVSIITRVFKREKGSEQFKKNEVRLRAIQAELIQAGDARTTAVRKARRPFLNEMNKKQKESVRPMTTEEHAQAMKDLNTIVHSTGGLPSFDSQLSILGSDAVRKTGFGEGLLSAACRRALASPDLVDLLKGDKAAEDKVALEQAEEAHANGDDEDDITFDTQPEAGDHDVGSQEPIRETLPRLDDSNELEVLDGDLAEAKIAMMQALYRPIIQQKLEKQIVAAHDGKWPCLVCETLSEEQRPSRVFLFDDKPHLLRHQRTHGDFFMLTQYMFTEDKNVFKCPVEDCSYRSPDLESVREHCVDQCKERTLFQRMKQEDADRGPDALQAEGERRRKARSMIERLQKGIALQEYEQRRIAWWADLDSEKVADLAEICQVDPSELEAFMPEIAEMMSATKSLITDGVLQDPRAGYSIESATKEYMTHAMQQKVDALIDRATAAGHTSDL